MTIPSWAKVGAKVATTHDGINTNTKKGDVFIVRDVIQIGDEVGIKVHGIPDSLRLTGHWCISSFCPVQTKTLEQDMEIFAPLLETEKEMVE